MDVFYEKGKKYNCRVNGKPYFRTSISINGKLKQIYGDGEKDANRKKAELKSEADSGLNVDYRNADTKEVFRYWLYNVKRVDKDLKASSFALYEASYRNHIAPHRIVNGKLRNLSFAAMQAYLTSLYEDCEQSSASILSTLRVWKMFTKWAVSQGYLIKDPCAGLSVPGRREAKKKEIEVFTAEERSALLAYMRKTHYRYDTLIELAFATGMRKGELLGLKWENVSDTDIRVTQATAFVTHVDKDGNRKRYREEWDPKTANSVRTIPILPSTHEMLEQHHAKQRRFFLERGLGTPEYLFTTSVGALLSTTTLSASYEKLLRQAGIPHRKFHAIRHTFATEAIRRGVDVKDLQKLMGHSDVRTTYIYVQSDDASKRNAIERMGAIM